MIFYVCYYRIFSLSCIDRFLFPFSRTVFEQRSARKEALNRFTIIITLESIGKIKTEKKKKNDSKIV